MIRETIQHSWMWEIYSRKSGPSDCFHVFTSYTYHLLSRGIENVKTCKLFLTGLDQSRRYYSLGASWLSGMICYFAMNWRTRFKNNLSASDYLSSASKFHWIHSNSACIQTGSCVRKKLDIYFEIWGLEFAQQGRKLRLSERPRRIAFPFGQGNLWSTLSDWTTTLLILLAISFFS